MPTARHPHWSRQYPPARPPVRSARRSAAAVLVASALAGITAYSVGGSVSSVDLATAQCDRPTAVRQLAAARQIRSDTRALLSDLRLDNPADPRARVLSRQLSDLGFMPSQYDGWRQKAIDVSDQLTGTRDPKLRAVALTLARRGYGPTPADLLADPPPDQDGGQGEVLGQGAGPSLGGVVDSAAEAADRLLRPPASAAPGAGSTPRKRPSAEPALPQVCASGSTEPAATPTTARQPAPTASPTTPQPTTARLTPAPSSAPTGPEQPPATSVQDPTDDQSQPAPSSSDQPSSSTSAPGSSTTATPAPSATADPDLSGSGSGQPVDLDQARAAIQLLGELMQALGAGNGDQEATELRDLIEQAINSGQPQLQPVGQRPTDSVDPAEPTTIADPDRATSPTSQGEGGSGGGSGDWEPAADKLAEQASEAAATDPLARQLLDKLRDAGVDVSDQSDTAPSSSTPDSSESGDQTDQPDDESTSPSPSTPDPTESGDQTDQPDNGSVPSARDDKPDADGEQPQDPAATEAPGGSQQGAGIQDATWDKLADCESSGDWSADTGNGYSGGLQFSPETWEAFGGAGDPATASREQQIAVATKVQAEQGWKAWPSCSKKLGL